MEIKDGGKAFPFQTQLLFTEDGKQGYIVNEGMSLRDYFAAAFIRGPLHGGQAPQTPEVWAELAYECADAMIAARGKK